jgi:hypothetical protein
MMDKKDLPLSGEIQAVHIPLFETLSLLGAKPGPIEEMNVIERNVGSNPSHLGLELPEQKAYFLDQLNFLVCFGSFWQHQTLASRWRSCGWRLSWSRRVSLES